MKTMFLASVLALAAPAALAADFPVKAYPATAAAAAYSWTGFYIGGFGDYSWQRSGFPDPAVGTMKADGFMGGVTIGGDYQTGSVVFGAIGDVAFGNVGVTAMNGSVMTENVTEKIFATARGRLGYLVTPQLLFYGTAGLGIASVDHNETCPEGAQFGFCSTKPRKAGPYSLTGDQLYLGYVAGAGVEWQFARNWSTKVEYLYSDLGAKTYFLGASPIGVPTNTREISLKQQQVRFGVNYRF